jgi:hypothetical protein
MKAVELNSPQNTRHFAGDLTVRIEMEIVIVSLTNVTEHRRCQ